MIFHPSLVPHPSLFCLGGIILGLQAQPKTIQLQAKVAKKYPNVCYAEPSPTVAIIFYTVTPDVHHSTLIENRTSTESTPVSATVTDQNGNTSQVNGTEQTTTTTSTAVPYSGDCPELR